MSAAVARQRRVVAVTFGITAAVMGTWAVAHLAGYRYNNTPSYPIGIYRITGTGEALHRGELVIACPPRSAAIREARERGYLSRGWCGSGTVPVIKKVAGLPGDRVDVGAIVRVNGIAWPRSAPQRRDGAGRPMTRYGGGTVGAGEVLLLSDYNVESFDGRYFGPIPMADIEGRISLIAPI